MIAGERAAAWGLLADLLALPAAQRESAARLHPAWQTFGLAELLVERSTEAPLPAALELARLAVTVADCLDPERYTASLACDLQARAWAQLAEARRLDGDLDGAAKALDVAEDLCEEGSADPLLEAHLLERRAALLADQRDAAAAVARLLRAAKIYEGVGDAPGAARARLAASEHGAPPRAA